jgi:hypothetical protein
MTTPAKKNARKITKNTLGKVKGGAAKPTVTSSLAKASSGRTAAPAKGVNLSAKR